MKLKINFRMQREEVPRSIFTNHGLGLSMMKRSTCKSKEKPNIYIIRYWL
jgi:hypothetical protein